VEAIEDVPKTVGSARSAGVLGDESEKGNVAIECTSIGGETIGGKSDVRY
jgi:hypothetical protein